jgi:hypothetical protein
VTSPSPGILTNNPNTSKSPSFALFIALSPAVSCLLSPVSCHVHTSGTPARQEGWIQEDLDQVRVNPNLDSDEDLAQEDSFEDSAQGDSPFVW